MGNVQCKKLFLDCHNTWYSGNLWRQMANETTDVNIVDIKRVWEEIVPVNIQKESISLLCIMGMLFNVSRDPAEVIT